LISEIDLLAGEMEMMATICKSKTTVDAPRSLRSSFGLEVPL